MIQRNASLFRFPTRQFRIKFKAHLIKVRHIQAIVSALSPLRTNCYSICWLLCRCCRARSTLPMCRITAQGSVCISSCPCSRSRTISCMIPFSLGESVISYSPFCCPSYGCCSFTCWAGSVCAGDHRQHGDTLPLLKLLRSRQLVRFYARDDGVHNSWHRRVLCDTAALFVGAARALLLMLVRQAFRKKTEHNKVSLRGV